MFPPDPVHFQSKGSVLRGLQGLWECCKRLAATILDMSTSAGPLWWGRHEHRRNTLLQLWYQAGAFTARLLLDIFSDPISEWQHHFVVDRVAWVSSVLPEELGVSLDLHIPRPDTSTGRLVVELNHSEPPDLTENGPQDPRRDKRRRLVIITMGIPSGTRKS